MVEEHKPSNPEELAWPGDEWGNAASWDDNFKQLFERAGVATWRRAVEIGAGSGKYTLRVLGASAANVRAYDVSAQFLKVCEDRCKDWIGKGRLDLTLLESTSPSHMLSDLQACGWQRQVDAFYSIDAMVHVDLQYLVAYLLTAALVLKPEGKLILTLADATTALGFATLLGDISWTYKWQANPTGSAKFEWLSPDLIQTVLTRLGFKVDLLDNRARDMLLVATLHDVAMADGLSRHLFPPANAA
jgi:Methyltransferase domain